APRHRDLGWAAGLRRRPAAAQQVAPLGVGADPAAFVARRVVARAGGERRQGGERRGEDVAARRPRASAAPTAHRCTLPHSSSKVWTRTWFESRLTSVGTRAMSGGKSNSAGKPATVTKRSPGGSAGARRNGRRLATMKPHSPKLGTCAWYGVVASPAASIVVATVQKLLRAI